jgi:hypothetical protein
MKFRTTTAAALLAAALAQAGDGRYEISSSMLPLSITNGGSWVATENLTYTIGNAIVINANHVTLDLNGFQLIGATSATYGIIGQGRINTRIVNGTVRGFGINVSLTSCTNTQVRDLLVSHALYQGIELGPASLVRDCNIYANGGFGLEVGEGSVVSHCVVRDNSSAGIRATNGATTISYCAVRGNGNHGLQAGVATSIGGSVFRGNGGDGVLAAAGCQVSDCVVYQNGHGVFAEAAANVVNCTAFQNEYDGFRLGEGSSLQQSVSDGNLDTGVEVSSNCLVSANVLYQNNTNGLFASGEGNRIELNHAGAGATGYLVLMTNNLIVRNSASGNATEFNVAAGNLTGAVTNNPQTANTWSNFDH